MVIYWVLESKTLKRLLSGERIRRRDIIHGTVPVVLPVGTGTCTVNPYKVLTVQGMTAVSNESYTRRVSTYGTVQSVGTKQQS